MANGSLATHGIDCYELGQFTKLSKQEVINIAVATELAWTVILLFDDILDNDTVRYGQPTAWVQYGKELTEQSIHFGYQQAAKLHPYKRDFNNLYQLCIDAMNDIKQLPIDAGSQVIEHAYHGYAFGCYDYLLPFDKQTKELLQLIGYEKMLIAQLINDYKDTCGSRRAQREYPELREKQANYVTSLYVDSVDKDERRSFMGLLHKADSSVQYEQIAQLLQKNNAAVLAKSEQLRDSILNRLQRIPHEQLRLYLTPKVTELTASLHTTLETELGFK